MFSNKKIAVANWKMNPQTGREASDIFSAIKRKSIRTKISTMVCPPALYIPLLKSKLPEGQRLRLGAQNFFLSDATSHTGEISLPMLKSSGASLVILGHSERRALGETRELINKKILRSLKEGIDVIVCIGEEKRDPDGNFLSYIDEEIKYLLSNISKKNIIDVAIAYEPVWAIGKGESDALLPADLHEMVLFIKKSLSDIFGDEAKIIPILYGGSVTAGNAPSLMKEGGINGFLVGRESLSAEHFGEIMSIIEEN